MIQIRLYLIANAVFAICLLSGAMIGGSAAHSLYLLLLFALCSSPILTMRKLIDEYALLALYSLFYFFWYGFLDFLHLFSGQIDSAGSDGVLDNADAVILAGGATLQVAYRFVCRALRPAGPPRIRDWSEATLNFMGLTLWLTSTWLVWTFSVDVMTDASVESVARGLAGLTPLQTDAFMLATYFQPFSIMVLAYALFRFKRSYMLPVVIGAVFVQFVIGFVADAKGQALSGVFILLIAKFLVDRRISKTWLLVSVAVIAVAFPVLQANRAIRHQKNLSHAAAAENLTQAFQQALRADEQPHARGERAQNVFERVSIKDTLEVIITKSGSTVPFSHGDTLSPLLTAFIPRLLWPDKPGIQVGLLVAKVFFPDASSDVNLSPSHLGELYWNFGWLGVLCGMPLIGAALGLVGSRCNLSQTVTLTRVLVLLVTIQVIVVGFEATIATQYSVWLRMMLGIGVLHWMFAHRRLDVGEIPNRDTREPQAAVSIQPRFPNLLR